MTMQSIDKIIGPLIVAGIIALVGFAWRISSQVEQMEAKIQSIQTDVVRNRKVMCAVTKKEDMFVGECVQ